MNNASPLCYHLSIISLMKWPTEKELHSDKAWIISIAFKMLMAYKQRGKCRLFNVKALKNSVKFHQPLHNPSLGHSPNVSPPSVCFGFSSAMLFLDPVALFLLLSLLFFVNVFDKRDGDFNCRERYSNVPPGCWNGIYHDHPNIIWLELLY